MLLFHRDAGAGRAVTELAHQAVFEFPDDELSHEKSVLLLIAPVNLPGHAHALTLRHLEERPAPLSGVDLAWAAANLFTVDAFFAFAEAIPEWIDSAPPSLLAIANRSLDEFPDEVVAEISQWLAQAIARHQLADRRHWRKIIAELRELRARGQLMTEGASVR
jgi:hypothetical protein